MDYINTAPHVAFSNYFSFQAASSALPREITIFNTSIFCNLIAFSPIFDATALNTLPVKDRLYLESLSCIIVVFPDADTGIAFQILEQLLNVFEHKSLM